MWLSECQPLNRNRIWHACTQLKKCELPHRVFDLNVTCHQEKAWSNISRAIIECYKQSVFIHWHSLSSPFHFKCLVIEIHWTWEMPQADQHWGRFGLRAAAPTERHEQGARCKAPHPSAAPSAGFHSSSLRTEGRQHCTHPWSSFLQTSMTQRKQICLEVFPGSDIHLFRSVLSSTHTAGPN